MNGDKGETSIPFLTCSTPLHPVNGSLLLSFPALPISPIDATILFYIHINIQQLILKSKSLTKIIIYSRDGQSF